MISTTPTVEASSFDLAPAQRAEAITGRPYLSWSQINSFRSCPRAFTFKYVEAVEPAFVSSNLLFGGAVHSALQHHFEQRLQGLESTSDELVEAYRLAWHQRLEEAGDVPVRYGQGEDAESLTGVAGKLLEAFTGSDLATPEGEVLAVEEKLSGELAEDLPPLFAIVDLITHNEGVLNVIDFKTSRSKWSAAKAREGAAQLQLYRSLVGDLAEGATAVKLSFGVLVKTKTPSIQQLAVEDGEQTPANLAEVLRPVWRAMILGIDYANPSTTGCSGCPYRHRCPAHVM